MTEPLLLPKTDVEVILRISQKLPLYVRGLITDVELINTVIEFLTYAKTDEGIQQTAARLPQAVLKPLSEFIAQIESGKSPGILFTIPPGQPTDEEREERNRRVRHIVGVLADFIKRPVAEREIAGFPHDEKAEFLFRLNTVAETTCKQEGCELSRVKYGVFCPEHHYEMLHQFDTPSE